MELTKSKRKKFLFIGCSTIQKNAVLFRLLLARYLVQERHEVHLLLEDDPVNRDWVAKKIPGAQTHYLSVKPLLELVIERRRLIKQIQPDIVHILGIGVQNVLTMPILSKPSSPVYIPDLDELMSAKASSLARRLLNRYLEEQALRISQTVICASKFLVEHLSHRHGRDRNQFLELPYAYDPESFATCQLLADKIRSNYRPRKIVVYMGTLCKEYQSDQILKLAQNMQKHRQNLVFIVIGDGPKLKTHKQWVLQSKLEDFVFFLGYIPESNVYSYLKAADVLLFPIKDNIQNKARCPNKTFQYIAANRPIVTNKVGEVERALGSDAYYYEFDSIESFKKAVIAALADSNHYTNSRLLSLHTWEKRTIDYQRWLSSIGLF